MARFGSRSVSRHSRSVDRIRAASCAVWGNDDREIRCEPPMRDLHSTPYTAIHAARCSAEGSWRFLMRRSRLDFTGTLHLGTALLAMMPMGSQADLERQSPTCPVAIELKVETRVAWGPAEWQLLTDEVDRIWQPYGLTLCWARRLQPCAGWGVHLDVLVTDDLPPSVRPDHLEPVIGRIRFDAHGPSTDLALSVK